MTIPPSPSQGPPLPASFRPLPPAPWRRRPPLPWSFPALRPPCPPERCPSSLPTASPLLHLPPVPEPLSRLLSPLWRPSLQVQQPFLPVRQPPPGAYPACPSPAPFRPFATCPPAQRRCCRGRRRAPPPAVLFPTTALPPLAADSLHHAAFPPEETRVDPLQTYPLPRPLCSVSEPPSSLLAPCGVHPTGIAALVTPCAA